MPDAHQQEHDCGHDCCEHRADPFHDHFLTPDACKQCAAVQRVNTAMQVKVKELEKQVSDSMKQTFTVKENIPDWVCSTCNGTGWLPIPDNPEFDVDNECESPHVGPFKHGTEWLWADPTKVVHGVWRYGHLNTLPHGEEGHSEDCGFYPIGERLTTEDKG